MRRTGGAGPRGSCSVDVEDIKVRRANWPRRDTMPVVYSIYLVNVQVGLSGLEPEASALSGQRSNQLS
jgi:hypothetical protein